MITITKDGLTRSVSERDLAIWINKGYVKVITVKPKKTSRKVMSE